MTESSCREIQERTGWQQGIFHHFVHPIKDDKGACITSKPVLTNTKTQRPVVFCCISLLHRSCCWIFILISFHIIIFPTSLHFLSTFVTQINFSLNASLHPRLRIRDEWWRPFTLLLVTYIGALCLLYYRWGEWNRDGVMSGRLYPLFCVTMCSTDIYQRGKSVPAIWYKALGSSNGVRFSSPLRSHSLYLINKNIHEGVTVSKKWI